MSYFFTAGCPIFHVTDFAKHVITLSVAHSSPRHWLQLKRQWWRSAKFLLHGVYMKYRNGIKKISAAVALLGCAASASVMAQRSDIEHSYNSANNSSWYIAPSINAIRPDKKFGDEHHGEGVGLRFGKAISPMWDIQFGPTYARQRYAGVRYQQDTLGVDALYMFSRSSFRPFLLIGGGAEYDKVENYSRGIKRDSTSPYLNAGLGFQLSFSDHWGMQADVRRAHSFISGNEFGFDRAKTSTATIGLTYAFGSRPAARPTTRVAPEAVSVAPEPTVVVVAPAPVAPAPPPPRFERITLSANELFEFDRAELRMPQTKLDEIAVALSNNTQLANITISGYTDRLGSEAYNMKLSQRRADAVKGYLTNKGIAASRLTAVAKGESNPVVTCTNKNRAELIKCLEPNRRVEVEQIVIERRVQ
jgi:OOP family OmpA-OmpF porin